MYRTFTNAKNNVKDIFYMQEHIINSYYCFFDISMLVFLYYITLNDWHEASASDGCFHR